MRLTVVYKMPVEKATQLNFFRFVQLPSPIGRRYSFRPRLNPRRNRGSCKCTKLRRKKNGSFNVWSVIPGRFLNGKRWTLIRADVNVLTANETSKNGNGKHRRGDGLLGIPAM